MYFSHFIKYTFNFQDFARAKNRCPYFPSWDRTRFPPVLYFFPPKVFPVHSAATHGLRPYWLLSKNIVENLGNLRKFQEIKQNSKILQEILENHRKFQEIQGNLNRSQKNTHISTKTKIKTVNKLRQFSELKYTV